jgi:hypothetical protein
MASGGDSLTCGIGAASIEGNPGLLCSLGVSMMKNGFWIYDLTNAEISFALVAPRSSKRQHLVRLPKGGVKELVL